MHKKVDRMLKNNSKKIQKQKFKKKIKKKLKKIQQNKSKKNKKFFFLKLKNETFSKIFLVLIEEVELLEDQLSKLKREKINLDNKMFEVINDFSGIQRSLVPAVNLTTTDQSLKYFAVCRVKGIIF